VIRIPRPPLPVDLAGHLAALAEKVTATGVQFHHAEARRLWELNTTRSRVRNPIRAALCAMAPGDEQCMYCGEVGTDIEHFEPVARNPLRTFDWLNHLLACSTCNSHKRDQFPVGEGDQPLLIDPTIEDPFDHLQLALSEGVYAALSDKGETTIAVCNLNRPQLTRARKWSRGNAEICLRQWAVAYRDGDEPLMREVVRTVQEQPCADVCQAMLREAEGVNANIIFEAKPDVLTLLRRPELREALLS